MADTIPCGENKNCIDGDASSYDWSLEFTKICGAEFSVSSISFPSISIAPVNSNTPLSILKFPGDILDFSDLSLSFIVDEKFINYEQIYNWFIKMGFPDNHDQFPQDDNKYQELFADASLSITKDRKKSNIAFFFEDLFPTNISGFQLAFGEDSSTLKCDVTFSYRLFSIVRKP